MKMRWIVAWPISVLLVVSAPALGSPTQPSGLQSSAKVVRDDQGIPHIFAKTERDLYFLTGWMHAQDRFFQMDAARRRASGTLAELLGPDALGGDVESRNLGIRRAAERSLAQLSQPVQKALEAYSAGVNAYRAEHPLPPEYAALEVATVAPWTPLDSVAVGKAIAFSLSFELDIGPTQRLRQYQDAGARGGFDGTALYFEDLNRTAPFDPAATVPDALGRPGTMVRSPAEGNRIGSDVPALGQAPGSGLDPTPDFPYGAATHANIHRQQRMGHQRTVHGEWPSAARQRSPFEPDRTAAVLCAPPSSTRSGCKREQLRRRALHRHGA